MGPAVLGSPLRDGLRSHPCVFWGPSWHINKYLSGASLWHLQSTKTKTNCVQTCHQHVRHISYHAIDQSKSHYQALNQGLENHLLPAVEQSFITKAMSAGRGSNLSCSVTLFSSFITKKSREKGVIVLQCFWNQIADIGWLLASYKCLWNLLQFKSRG